MPEPVVEPEALPEGDADDEPEGELEAMPELEAEPDGALEADFSFGCCVTRSRQCVAGDTLPLAAPGDGLDDEDCAAAVSMLPPTNAEASNRV